MRRRTVLSVAALVTAATLIAPAAAERGLMVGISDDAFQRSPEQSVAIARDLGVTAFRIGLRWDGIERRLSDDDVERLDHIVAATTPMRMIVSIYGSRADEAPRTAGEREAYCSYAADLLRRYPSVRDIVVWNEANLAYFWRPQFDHEGVSTAPAAYEALLARCWDVLHAERRDVNVISDISSRGNDNPRARSNVSHSPGTFIAGVGAADRASRRRRPIFDTFGHNPYSQSDEPPWEQHPGSTQISEGDLDRLLADLASAFEGTGQPVPGSCAGSRCPTVWYLEAGYQTSPTPDKLAVYRGYETDPSSVPDGDAVTGRRDQGDQLRAGLALAYCQPAVGAFFNFLLADDPELEGWQSGLLWADQTKKAAYAAFKGTTAAIRRHAVDCSTIERATAPR